MNEPSPVAGGSAPRSRLASVLDPTQEGRWQLALAGMDASTRFLCEQWMPLLEETYGFQPRLITLWDGAEHLAAAMPYVVVSSPFTGRRGVSLPFFDQCRSYCPHPQDFDALYGALRAQGQSDEWDYLELRGDLRKLRGIAPSLSFYNHVVSLSGGPDAVFSRMAPSAQRAVRKARKEGVEVRRSQSFEALEEFYRLQCLTRRRHGLPPQPFRFFRNLHQRLIATNQGSIFTAYHRGQAVASSVFLLQGDIVHYKYGASDERRQIVRGNNSVMWTAFEHYALQGYGEMHLGRNSITNDGLRRYKLSLGAVEGATRYHRYDFRRNAVSKMRDDVYGWHNRIFSNLPLPLTRLAGSLLYKHIA